MKDILRKSHRCNAGESLPVWWSGLKDGTLEEFRKKVKVSTCVVEWIERRHVGTIPQKGQGLYLCGGVD